MAQLVPKLNIFHRFGGYEPSIGVHFPSLAYISQGLADALVTAVAPLYPGDVLFTSWEARDAAGVFQFGGQLAGAGQGVGEFDDFRDCTHVTYSSGGTQRASGNFFQGRLDSQWTKGQATAAFTQALEDWLLALKNLDATDSEGFTLTGLRTVRPGRRRRVRLAP